MKVGFDEVLRAVYYNYDPVMLDEYSHLGIEGISSENLIPTRPIDIETEASIEKCSKNMECRGYM